MAKGKSKRLDLNQIAASIVLESTSDKARSPVRVKNSAAVALGRLGGLKGGKARAAKLSASQRSAIAKSAAAARWKQKKKD